MFERFTRNARAVVIGAQELAARARAAEVRPAHLLESLAVRDDTLPMKVLAGLGAPGDDVRRVVRGLNARYADGLDADDAEALKLLGVLRQGDSTALETLRAFDLTVDDVRRAVDEADRRAG